MSEDLTKRLSDKDEILTVIKNLESYVRSSIDNLQTSVGSIDARLTRLEQRVEERLHDTRPMWHRVVADIAQLQASVERLEKGQGELRGHILDLSRAVRDVNRDQIVINDVARKIQLDFHTIDECLHRLEVNRN
jgi:chromosome segregation ATPase